MMEKLNLPSCSFRLKKLGQSTQIFDIVRKKYTLLTPEEWVRQHIIHFLIYHKGYPASRLGIEKGITFNSLRKRVDIIVYDKSALPFMIVECKAPGVKLLQGVFDQASVYNLSLQVKVLMLTNGLQHFCYKINQYANRLEFLNDVPDCPQEF